MRISLLTAVAIIGFATTVRGAEPVDNEYFEKRVRPILVANCVNCHGAKKQKGGLRLDSKAGFAKGGDNGASRCARRTRRKACWCRRSATTATSRCRRRGSWPTRTSRL